LPLLRKQKRELPDLLAQAPGVVQQVVRARAVPALVRPGQARLLAPGQRQALRQQRVWPARSRA
jgi:hypothetical protein